MKFIFQSSLFLFLITSLICAQNIEVITPYGTTKYEPVGTFDIEIDFIVVNTSPDTQVVFEVRTINDLPPDWSSSLCFGLCYPPNIDSIATTTDFGMSPVAPGDTLITSVHAFTDMISVATALVQLQIGTFTEPENRITINFRATTDPSLDVNETSYFNSYNLSQNYPNPFNPTTTINYKIGEPGFVQLKVYNVLGIEVATLINEFKNAGNYSVDFDASKFSSGVYFYSLSANNFTQTRKMILEK